MNTRSGSSSYSLIKVWSPSTLGPVEMLHPHWSACLKTSVALPLMCSRLLPCPGVPRADHLAIRQLLVLAINLMIRPV